MVKLLRPSASVGSRLLPWAPVVCVCGCGQKMETWELLGKKRFGFPAHKKIGRNFRIIAPYCISGHSVRGHPLFVCTEEGGGGGIVREKMGESLNG